MRRKILEILNQAQFERDFIAFIESALTEHDRPKYAHPYLSDQANPLYDLDHESRLIQSLLDLPGLESDYLNRAIPLKYFYQNIQAINYRINRYYQQHGKYGLSDHDLKWSGSFFRAEFFELGCLGFELKGLDYSYLQRSEPDFMEINPQFQVLLPPASPVIFVHIKQGSNLSAENIDLSFDLARDFFSLYFPDHNYLAYLCRTWLLYPPTRDLLGPNSRITGFASRFEIIGQNTNSKQALDRIYGTSDLHLIKKMPKTTSLEKSAYLNLDKLGVAAGLIWAKNLSAKPSSQTKLSQAGRL